MSRKDQDMKKLIKKLYQAIEANLPKHGSKHIIEFARQFYETTSYEEIFHHDVEGLSGVILSLWKLIDDCKPKKSKIKIYNPTLEEHGWHSKHTIVEIVNDDMPFLVDSIRMEINRQGYTMYLMVHLGGLKLSCDEKGKIIDVLPLATPVGKNVISKAPMYIEIDKQTDPLAIEKLEQGLESSLHAVRCAVEDWPTMQERLNEAFEEVEQYQKVNKTKELSETKDFLRWIKSSHFIFLGYCNMVSVGAGDKKNLKVEPGSGLGILRNLNKTKRYLTFDSESPNLKPLASYKNILILSKTGFRSEVHRAAFEDYIGIRQFNKAGELVAEHRFIGLYTSASYNADPKLIPFVRRKIATILKRSNLSPTGHAGRALLNILETFPRDDLFQASVDELFEISIGILHIQERKKVHLFARKDPNGCFISCLVYVPREVFTTELALAMKGVLDKAFNALESSYMTRFSDSILARVHFIIHLDPEKTLKYNLKEIEKKLVQLSRSWRDELQELLIEEHGEEEGNILVRKYRKAFHAGYREIFSPETAVDDINHIESLSEKLSLTMRFYQTPEDGDRAFHFKLFCPKQTIPLSDILPIFENMGLKVIGERPYEISLPDKHKIWINDFSVVYSQETALEIEPIKKIFQDAFFNFWSGNAESDGFNRLILNARLSWREITILRAFTKYLWQVGLTYSQSYVEEIFAKHPVAARLLVHLFMVRFNPDRKKNGDKQIDSLEISIKEELDNIATLDEDKILRRFYEVIKATMRTNYFQKDEHDKAKLYLSFKLDPSLISDFPLPMPMYEIFVYSPRFEGIHLRNSRVARGGIRWSDRREDFRTEVLGLMKAQNVKNTVIVPSGAKGGFVPKCLPVEGSREEIIEEVTNCYKTFICGLLDLTDNIKGDKICPPSNVVRYDPDDTYLVVAADKGTSTFSDIANSLAKEYGFWLGDAFASGGSTGYDHKKMGITARGAWVSVKRLFREVGHNVQTTDFTAIGIGDMSGDVFGNGVLLSKHLRLVGAFDHLNIFLDPNPDPQISCKERRRLFDLPRSTWENYNRELISNGGGVYNRTSKAIKLTDEVKKLFNIDKDFMVPNDIIRAMLKAKVDLIWNGGIGTFVKASTEEHADVEDKTNDAIRVNASDLNCRVIGEGGNLGVTQLARIEYALKGGRLYTDFIDNSAGVDCSDHEVNIKILLDGIVSNKKLTQKDRNSLLSDMTDDVTALVLSDNYHQTQAISLIESQAYLNVDLHYRYIQDLVQKDLLDRELEFLPNEQVILDRKAMGKGLTCPELAILFSYCKANLKKDILKSDIPEDPCLANTVGLAFPKLIRERYKDEMQSHRLSREIIATLLTNDLVNEMGFTFVYQLHHETGAPVAAIVRAYMIARDIFSLPDTWERVEQLDYKIQTELQLEIMNTIARLIRRATRWILRNRRMHLNISNTCEHFSPCVKCLSDRLEDMLTGYEKEKYDETKHRLLDSKVPEELATRVAGERAMVSSLEIIEATDLYSFNLNDVAVVYFMLGEKLELGWLRDQIDSYAGDNEWDSLAKEASRDDLDWQQRGLTIAVLQGGMMLETIDEKITFWLDKHKHLIERWHVMLSKLRNSTSPNFVMFYVAIRELMDLTQTSFHDTV